MNHPSRRAKRFLTHAEATAAREVLEHRWTSRLRRTPELARWVTAGSHADEPFHRWVTLRQGFSPELIRLFLGRYFKSIPTPDGDPRPGGRGSDLKQPRSASGLTGTAASDQPPGRSPVRLADSRDGPRNGVPVLDPFGGAGTTVIECARNGVEAVAVEAVPALAFLANARFIEDRPARPVMDPEVDWKCLAGALTHPLHRAALMISVAELKRDAPGNFQTSVPLGSRWETVLSRIEEDLRNPLPVRNRTIPGDARDLSPLDRGSVGAIITSPPYLSRYDYSKIAAPLVAVYQSWRVDEVGGQDHHRQLRAFIGPVDARSRKTKRIREESTASIDAVDPTAVGVGGGIDVGGRVGIGGGVGAVTDEITRRLTQRGEPQLAAVVAGYLNDLRAVLTACARVTVAGAPCWFVVGGARVRGVYVPTDLLLAELAESVGFVVHEVCAVRALIPAPRKLGSLGGVAPRESVVVLQRL